MAIRISAATDGAQRSVGSGLSSGPITIGAWVYVDVDRNTYTYFLGADDASANYHLLGFGADGLTPNLSATGGFVLAPSAIATGTWYYMASVYVPGGTSTIYWAAYGAGSFSSATNTGVTPGIADAWTFYVGNDGFDEFLNGRVGHVRVWNAALTSTELLAEMASETLIRTANVWGAWALEDDYLDSSGNGRTLTPSGSTSFIAGPVLASSPPATPEAPIFDSAWDGGVHGYLLNLPSDNGSAITGYKWQTAPQVAGSPGTPTLVTGQTTRELYGSGLTNGTPYYIRVAATNVGGDSSYSSWAGPKTPVAAGEYGKLSSSLSIKLGSTNSLRIESLPPTFATSIDPTNRYVMDQNGDPLLIAGDTAWSISAALTTDDITMFVADRKAKGVTALIASLPEPYYGPNAPNNLAGQSPFTGALFASGLNDPYWLIVDHFLNECKKAGITVFFCPFYLGYPGGGDGFSSVIIGVTNTNMRTYADNLLARYPAATYPNIVWFLGHDRTPTSTELDRGLAFIDQVRGVHADPRLMIYGGVHNRDINGTDTFGIGAEDWSTTAATYPPDIHTQYDYSQWNVVNADTIWGFSPTRPHIFIEGIYDEEQGIGLGSVILRRQLFGPFVDGGAGGFIGINPIWNFGYHAPAGYTGTWQTKLNSKASLFLKAFRDIIVFQCKGWHETVCDTTSTFVTNRGTNGARVAARYSTKLGIIYHPNFTSGSLTLNLNVFTAWTTVKVTRVDPASGARTVVDASESITNAAFNLAAPGTNSEGDNDWLFLVEGVS